MPSRERTIAEILAGKLEDGNISAAARTLCSDKEPVQINETTLEELHLTLEELHLKHPISLWTVRLSLSPRIKSRGGGMVLHPNLSGGILWGLDGLYPTPFRTGTPDPFGRRAALGDQGPG